MKKITQLFALSIAMLGFSATVKAQNTSTSPATNATATIVAPITIAKGTDLVFGNVVSSGATGTVTIDTDGLRSATGGASFSAAFSGSPAASSFQVTGEPNYTYDIELPASTTISNGTVSMTVDNFTSNPGISAGLLDETGQQTLMVGATLNLTANQAVGQYTGTYTVKVNYN